MWPLGKSYPAEIQLYLSTTKGWKAALAEPAIELGTLWLEGRDLTYRAKYVFVHSRVKPLWLEGRDLTYCAKHATVHTGIKPLWQEGRDLIYCAFLHIFVNGH